MPPPRVGSPGPSAVGATIRLSAGSPAVEDLKEMRRVEGELPSFSFSEVVWIVWYGGGVVVTVGPPQP